MALPRRPATSKSRRLQGTERTGIRGHTCSVEQYVKAIYRLQTPDAAAGTVRIAKCMDVSPGSATAMFKKLADLGMATHIPYQGIRLLPDGERLGRRLVRAHRIVEVLLYRTLNLPWARLHDWVCGIEHHVDDELVGAMERKMGFPKRCPHGNLVDPAEADDCQSLHECGAGSRFVVVKVTNESTAFLRQVEALGLVPDAIAKVVSTTDASWSLSVAGGRIVTTGREVAEHVWVKAG